MTTRLDRNSCNRMGLVRCRDSDDGYVTAFPGADGQFAALLGADEVPTRFVHECERAQTQRH